MPPKRKLSVMLEIESTIELNDLKSATYWDELLWVRLGICVTQASAHVIQEIEEDEDGE